MQQEWKGGKRAAEESLRIVTNSGFTYEKEMRHWERDLSGRTTHSSDVRRRSGEERCFDLAYGRDNERPREARAPVSRARKEALSETEECLVSTGVRMTSSAGCGRGSRWKRTRRENEKSWVREEPGVAEIWAH
ncbi:hypothetical protein B0H19DRAFT_1238567 [Mycena capillaripes]|nr:hypothetical protein B0H19DRAFT_1238567 [Mycena capillaripes]